MQGQICFVAASTFEMAQKGGVTTAPVATGQCGVFFPLLSTLLFHSDPATWATFVKCEFLFLVFAASGCCYNSN
jgi:hypothetical protein